MQALYIARELTRFQLYNSYSARLKVLLGRILLRDSAYSRYVFNSGRNAQL